jgi:tetrahydromethanopterin S-methyltransferase subunit G
MEAMREGWNDDRLDEFAAQTDRRFDRLERRMETGFAEIRQEMDIRFDKVDARFDKVDERFERLDARIDALNHTLNRAMLQFGTGLIVTIALGFAGLIVAH